jgi:preprotein translocase subunit YajC
LTTLAFALPAQLPIFFVMLAVLYFVMIVPGQRKQKAWGEMLGKIKSGDTVVTNSGIRGVIVSVRDEVIILRIAPDNIKLEFSKNAIASVTTSDDGATK